MSALATQVPPVTAQRIEELGRIIMAYSEVTERLQESHDRLEQTVQSLRDELSEKNRQLERKTRLAALGEMAAGMAHEIRNPLGGIRLYTSLLEKDLADRPAACDVVRKITLGVRRLEALVSEVLQFTREMALQLAEADLGQVVEQAVEASAVSATGVRLEVRGPRPMPVRIDERLVGQAILNLLINAIQAMDGAGSLLVEYSPPLAGSEARQFVLRVQDSGPGIPAAAIDRIFNPFFTTKDTGTGLGLALVHRVVEAHEGSITAVNVPQGGARFEVRI